MTVEINKAVPDSVLQMIDDLIRCLGSTEDIRLCLSKLASIAFSFRGLIDLYTDPEMRFISYLITDQLANVQSAYGGKTEDWHTLNASNVSEMRKKLEAYFKTLLEAIKKNDYSQIIEGTKTFFAEFHGLFRMTTLDVKRGQ